MFYDDFMKYVKSFEYKGFKEIQEGLLFFFNDKGREKTFLETNNKYTELVD